MEKHQPELERFVKQHLWILQAEPNAFISVSASASRKDPESQAGVRRCIDDFISRTGWRPDVCEPVGGAIKYTKYNFILRAIMRRISAKNGGPTDTSRDHELTDWVALDRFLENLFSSKRVLDIGKDSAVMPLNDNKSRTGQVTAGR
jgi:menaquinone-dependent protoporphyrinogen oxidase